MLDSSLRALDEKFNASLTTANEDWGKRFDSLEPLVQELHKLLTTDLPHAIRDLEKRLMADMATKADVRAQADRVIEAIQRGTSANF